MEKNTQILNYLKYSVITDLANKCAWLMFAFDGHTDFFAACQDSSTANPSLMSVCILTRMLPMCGSKSHATRAQNIRRDRSYTHTFANHTMLRLDKHYTSISEQSLREQFELNIKRLQPVPFTLIDCK